MVFVIPRPSRYARTKRTGWHRVSSRLGAPVDGRAIGNDVVWQRNRLEFFLFKLLIAFRRSIRAVYVEFKKHIILQGSRYSGFGEDVCFHPVAIRTGVATERDQQRHTFL